MCKHAFFIFGLIVTISVGADAKRQRLKCQKRPHRAEVAEQLAGRLFMQAEAEFEKRRFRRALKRFLCSLAVVEHENTVLNIAQVITHIENRKVALDLLRGYVQQYPKGELTPEIAKMADEMERRSDNLEAGSSPPENHGALGEEAPPAAGTENRYNGNASAESAAEMGGVDGNGETDTTGRAANADDGRQREGINWRFWAWSGIGFGALSLIAGSVLQGMTLSARQDARDAKSYNQFLSDKDSSEKFQVGATVSFVIGGLAAGAGLTTLFWDRRSTEEKAVHTGLVVGGVLSPGWVGIRGRF